MTLEEFKNFFKVDRNATNPFGREPIIICNNPTQRNFVLKELSNLGYRLGVTSASYLINKGRVERGYLCPGISTGDVNEVCCWTIYGGKRRTRTITYETFEEMITSIACGEIKPASKNELFKFLKASTGGQL